MATRLPQRLMGSERLQTYSDAIYAIIITIMVVPLVESVDQLNTDEDLLESLKVIYVKIIVYVVAFLIIYSFWEGHVWIFQCIDYVGDTVVLTNLIMLLIMTFIPYAITLLAEHIEESFSILLFCGTLLIITLLELFIVFLSLCKPKMVREELRESGQFAFLRGSILIALIVKMLLIILAGGLSMVNLYASWAATIAILFSNAVSASICAIYKQVKGNVDDPHGNCGKYLCHRLFGEKLHKGRVEAFSDGVFSIVATLIILDICTKAFPSKEKRESHDTLAEAIWQESSLLLIYASTFLTVGLLWFIHHSIFQFVFRVHRLMSHFNKWSLLFVGLMPFGFRLLNIYTNDLVSNSTLVSLSLESLYPNQRTDRKESYILQLNCVILFFASLCQLFMWLSGHWKRRKHFHSHHKGLNYGITVCKLLVYPIVSATLFGLAFSKLHITAELIAAVLLCVMLVHVFIKIMYEITFKTCARQPADDVVDTEIDDQLMALDSLPRATSKQRRAESFRAEFEISK
ncbi:endosomal/lysosomal proton channel TMEM175-like isoform X2 [Ptychodera flava]|uniref:endosomal/lysosomal proton channel TMEM175-like isoform X2 n=1 Tax=Ptychodera flava TaxID=63121 RepID=UPI00396A0B56